jgi:hypothetical protein
MRYEIEENTYAVRIFEDGSDVPFIYQPHNGSNVQWANKKEAEDWAKSFIDQATNPPGPFDGFYIPEEIDPLLTQEQRSDWLNTMSPAQRESLATEILSK